MKNLFLGFLIILSFNSFSQNNFRAMNWGDSVSDLKSQYPDAEWRTDSDSDIKAYLADDYVGGLKVEVAYIFVAEKLKAGAYEFKEKHSSNNLYHQDFLTVSEILNKKYEMERKEEWNKTAWKNNPDYIGYALAMGDVEITETYENEDTYIVHSISSDGFGGIQHVLAYAEINYIKEQRSSVLKDF